MGCYSDSCIEGDISYGDATLPCELGSGSGNDSLGMPTTGGGILGSVRADGDNFRGSIQNKNASTDNVNVGTGGGYGGTILLFLHSLDLSESGILSSVGGHGSLSGGGGGRIHFHWSDIPTGDVYWPMAIVKGSIHTGLVPILSLLMLIHAKLPCH